MQNQGTNEGDELQDQAMDAPMEGEGEPEVHNAQEDLNADGA